MKPVAFAYARPRSIEEAVHLLGDTAGAKVLAGGQTLGPMLNLRLAQPSLLVDITRIPELGRIEQAEDALVMGACVTHAAIEDGRAPDPANGLLRTVAAGIAYRAVRTRGTIGGSLAHADPAADWVSCLAALDAAVLIAGPGGRRRLPLLQFIRGAMDVDLGGGELIEGIRVPRLSPRARTGYAKICRKTGEFAEAIGVVVHDPERSVLRFVSGATGGKPILIDASAALDGPQAPPPSPADFDVPGTMQRLLEAGMAGDDYELRLHAVALRRALERVVAR